jgi:hypothetical protein
MFRVDVYTLVLEIDSITALVPRVVCTVVTSTVEWIHMLAQVSVLNPGLLIKTVFYK